MCQILYEARTEYIDAYCRTVHNSWHPQLDFADNIIAVGPIYERERHDVPQIYISNIEGS